MRRAALLVVLVLLAPAAAAQPMLYFMADGEIPLVGPGELRTTPPPPVDVSDPLAGDPPGARLILTGQDAVLPQEFIGGAGNNTGRLYGAVLLGLWAPEAPTMLEGDIIAELVVDGAVVASDRVSLQYNETPLPDPEAFVPEDPTDPNATIAHVQAAALAYLLPQLIRPPLLLWLDDDVEDLIIDVEVPEGADVTLRFRVAPTEGSALPIPTGIGQPIEYDHGLSPSFIVLPWYTEPVAQPEPQPAPPSEPPSTPAEPADPGGPEQVDDDDGEDSPGLGLLVGAVLIVAAVWLRRR